MRLGSVCLAVVLLGACAVEDPGSESQSLGGHDHLKNPAQVVPHDRMLFTIRGDLTSDQDCSRPCEEADHGLVYSLVDGALIGSAKEEVYSVTPGPNGITVQAKLFFTFADGTLETDEFTVYANLFPYPTTDPSDPTLARAVTLWIGHINGTSGAYAGKRGDARMSGYNQVKFLPTRISAVFFDNLYIVENFR